MKKLMVTIGFILFLATAAQASITLKFEGLQDGDSVSEYYNGGYSKFGTGPGPNYGITFDDNFLVTGMGGENNSVYSINYYDRIYVPHGFTGRISFDYMLDPPPPWPLLDFLPARLEIYGIYDGKNMVLADKILPETLPGVWTHFVVDFNGTGKDLFFSAAGYWWGDEFSWSGGTVSPFIDNITFESINPSAVPLPSGVWLLAAGFVRLIGYARRVIDT